MPNGHVKRQLVSEKDRMTNIVSRFSKIIFPISVSFAASKHALEVKSIGDSAILGSFSFCVIWPQPTKIGIFESSIFKLYKFYY